MSVIRSDPTQNRALELANRLMVILTLLHPQKQTPLKQWRFDTESLIRVGRAPENHVILEDPLVSRHHLELRQVTLPARAIAPAQPCWHLVNYSTNGTFVNGCIVSQELVPSDALIQLAQGGPILRFQILTTPLAQPSSPSEIAAPSSKAPALPKLLVAPPAIAQPACNHPGNTPENLFCIHCGQPTKVLKTIRQYQVLQVLGKGGMGTTYLVWQKLESPAPPGEMRVLKEMNADVAHIPKAKELFEREATTLRSLNHPGIPRFYDFFIEAGKPYLVMELLHGQDLEKLVRQQGPIPSAQAIAWMIQTCEVLEYLHQRPSPIIHRDIKPSNLLVQTVNNRIAVLDFGAVKAVGKPSGTRIGAEGYSAPEQNQGRPVTQSDLYAIGSSLIFLLTGENPTRFYKKENSGYRFLLDGVTMITPSLKPVIQQVTALHLGDRYHTAGELALALKNCLP